MIFLISNSKWRQQKISQNNFLFAHPNDTNFHPKTQFIKQIKNSAGYTALPRTSVDFEFFVAFGIAMLILFMP